MIPCSVLFSFLAEFYTAMSVFPHFLPFLSPLLPPFLLFSCAQSFHPSPPFCAFSPIRPFFLSFLLPSTIHSRFFASLLSFLFPAFFLPFLPSLFFRFQVWILPVFVFAPLSDWKLLTMCCPVWMDGGRKEGERMKGREGCLEVTLLSSALPVCIVFFDFHCVLAVCGFSCYSLSSCSIFSI